MNDQITSCLDNIFNELSTNECKEIIVTNIGLLNRFSDNEKIQILTDIKHDDDVKLLTDASNEYKKIIENNDGSVVTMRWLRQIDYDKWDQIDFLKYLNLSNRDIKTILPYIFKELYILEKLDLSYNQIAHINVNTFKGLDNLEGLDLSYNQITRINVNTFNDLNNLKELELNFNQIKELQPFLFKNLYNLETLNLNSNNIQKIYRNSFDGLEQLRKLNLGDNEITEYEDGALDSNILPKLYTLDISDNPNQSIIINNENLHIIRDFDEDEYESYDEYIRSANEKCASDPTIETFETENIDSGKNYPQWCHDDTDLYGDPWTEINVDDVVSIQYPNEPHFVCYKRDDLIHFMEQDDSIMFNWVQNPEANPMNDEGYGGMPGNICYRRELNYNRYITSKSYEYLKDHPEVKVYKAVHLGRKRIGNWRGTFGVGEKHGQIPGEDAYKLVPLEVRIVRRTSRKRRRVVRK